MTKKNEPPGPPSGGKQPPQPPKGPPPPGPSDTVASSDGDDWLGLGEDIKTDQPAAPAAKAPEPAKPAAPYKPAAPPPGRPTMILTADGRLVPSDKLPQDMIVGHSDPVTATAGKVVSSTGAPSAPAVKAAMNKPTDTIAAPAGQIPGAPAPKAPPPQLQTVITSPTDTVAAPPGQIPGSTKPPPVKGLMNFPTDTVAASPGQILGLTGAQPKKPVTQLPTDTVAAPPGQIPGSGSNQIKTIITGPPASAGTPSGQIPRMPQLPNAIRRPTSPIKTIVTSQTDTVAAAPGKIPGMLDTSQMKTMVTGPSDTVAASPVNLPGQVDTSQMKTMVTGPSDTVAAPPDLPVVDTSSLKTMVGPPSVAPPGGSTDTSQMQTMITSSGPPAQPSSADNFDTSQMKTMVGPPQPNTPSGDIGNMQTLVSGAERPPSSAVRTGSGGNRTGQKPGSRTISHPSGLKTPSGTRFPTATGSGTISGGGTGVRVPVTSSGTRFQATSSGVVQPSMVPGKRWMPAMEDIAEVHADNQLGNLEMVENGRILGQYILMKKLGQGGMGAVYRGIKMGLNTDVAIKILFAHLAAAKGGSDHQARFLREAQLAASLDHGNLVRVIDVQQDFNSGILYLVMEFVEGYSVADVIKKTNGALEEAEALELIIGACKGLRAAHQQNIVHRDIKPDNIMIRARDKAVKVADMGLAKAIGDQDEVSVSRTESVIGTPAYMAPEQARDSKHVDLRADIYSMGATLFHMTTFRLPFEDPQLFMLLKKVITEPVPDPRTYNEKLSENLSRIIKKCMAKQPDNRYQRIDELIDDLELSLRNIRGEKDAVVADIKLVVPEEEPEPPTPWYKHWITWAAIFIIVVSGVGYGAWYVATGGKTEFERTAGIADDAIKTNLIAKAEESIAKMTAMAKNDTEKGIIVEVTSRLTDRKYQNFIDEGKTLLRRDKKYTDAEAKFTAAQLLHSTDESKRLIEEARMGPFTDTIMHLIDKDTAKFDEARQTLRDAAQALGKEDLWIQNHALTKEITVAEAKFRVNEQLAKVSAGSADEKTVATAQAECAAWLEKTGSNTEVIALIDEMKKVAVNHIFQPRAETELRDEKFELVPKSIDWIKRLSPGDRLVDTLTTRLTDAKLAKENRDRREKTDKLLGDADKLLASKSFEKVAETQDLKLLDSAKGSYAEAEKYEDYPRDAKGEIIVDDKGKKKLRRSDVGFNLVQDLIDRYNLYQRYIADGDARLEFQRYDDSIEAYTNAGKTIKTDQVSQRITRASDRKANHEAIQNIESSILTDPIKAATYLQDKLEKVSDDPDLARVKVKLLAVTRPASYELSDLQVRFRLIPATTFKMGNDEGDDDEKPAYQVRLRYPYYMDVTEVTVKQYEALIPTYKRPLDAGGRPVPDEMPVTNVSWEDAVRYAQLLTDREKVKLHEHEIYRLPTEAEWEWAARGEDGRVYAWGNDWQDGYCEGGSAKFDLAPTVVGSFPSGASPFGIMDMTGNVSELCAGGYAKDAYRNRSARGIVTDPIGSDDTNLKVVRGGSAFTSREKLRTTKRFTIGKKDSANGVGFRLVRTVEPLAIDP